MSTAHGITFTLYSFHCYGELGAATRGIYGQCLIVGFDGPLEKSTLCCCRSDEIRQKVNQRTGIQLTKPTVLQDANSWNDLRLWRISNLTTHSLAIRTRATVIVIAFSVVVVPFASASDRPAAVPQTLLCSNCEVVSTDESEVYQKCPTIQVRPRTNNNNSEDGNGMEESPHRRFL